MGKGRPMSSRATRFGPPPWQGGAPTRVLGKHQRGVRVVSNRESLRLWVATRQSRACAAGSVCLDSTMCRSVHRGMLCEV